MTRSPLHFATYFDKHYLTRGLALYQSLASHSPPLKLWVLCLDDETFATLHRLRLRNVELISIDELERADPGLLAVKPTRQPVEYFWTCGPAYLRYLFDTRPEIDLLTYVDADVCFFDSPAPIYAQLGGGSILLVEHRQSHLVPASGLLTGLFNVGLLAFQRTANALACIERWREQCIEWCFLRKEEGRFGDQKYLDEWPSRWPDVVVLDLKGAGVGPWNLGSYTFTQDGDTVLVDDEPLIFYHFSMLRRIVGSLYDATLWMWRTPMETTVRRRIYEPYLRQLQQASRLVKSVDGPRPGTDNVLGKFTRTRHAYKALWHQTYVIRSPAR